MRRPSHTSSSGRKRLGTATGGPACCTVSASNTRRLCLVSAGYMPHSTVKGAGSACSRDRCRAAVGAKNSGFSSPGVTTLEQRHFRHSAAGAAAVGAAGAASRQRAVITRIKATPSSSQNRCTCLCQAVGVRPERQLQAQLPCAHVQHCRRTASARGHAQRQRQL